MDIKDFKIDDIVSLFHLEKPDSHSFQEIRCEENDYRYILFVDFPEGKYVIKMASNGFTTEERISGWVELIEQYRTIGYYSPALRKSVHHRFAERLTHDGKTFIVWEEELAKYSFPTQVELSRVNAEGTRHACYDEVIAFFGKVGQRHLKNTWGSSGFARLVPFGSNEKVDEVTECVETLDRLVKSQAPQFAERWQYIFSLFEKNREELRKIYPQLPTSVFQADWGETNLLIDENEHFQGVIDYNLAGEDTVLNMALSMGLFGFPYLKKKEIGPHPLPELNEEAEKFRIEEMFDLLRVFKKYYDFSEIEVQAAPLLYKYIIAIWYPEIKAFEKFREDSEKIGMLFDFMEHKLLRNDIDFRSALLK